MEQDDELAAAIAGKRDVRGGAVLWYIMMRAAALGCCGVVMCDCRQACMIMLCGGAWGCCDDVPLLASVMMRDAADACY